MIEETVQGCTAPHYHTSGRLYTQDSWRSSSQQATKYSQKKNNRVVRVQIKKKIHLNSSFVTCSSCRITFNILFQYHVFNSCKTTVVTVCALNDLANKSKVNTIFTVLSREVVLKYVWGRTSGSGEFILDWKHIRIIGSKSNHNSTSFLRPIKLKYLVEISSTAHWCQVCSC